jgi:chromosome segregation ATPase
MNPSYTEIPFNPIQTVLIENAAKVQDLGGKLLKDLQQKAIKLERKIKKKKDQIKSLEADVQDIQQQLAQLVPTQSSYENTIGLLMESLSINPPYQGSLVYDKSKPIALRMPAKVSSDTNP